MHPLAKANAIMGEGAADCYRLMFVDSYEFHQLLSLVRPILYLMLSKREDIKYVWLLAAVDASKFRSWHHKASLPSYQPPMAMILLITPFREFLWHKRSHYLNSTNIYSPGKIQAKDRHSTTRCSTPHSHSRS